MISIAAENKMIEKQHSFITGRNLQKFTIKVNNKAN